MFGTRLILCVSLIFVTVNLQAIKRVRDEKPTNDLVMYSYQSNVAENKTAEDEAFYTTENKAQFSVTTPSPYINPTIRGSNRTNINKTITQTTNNDETENEVATTTNVRFENTTDEKNEINIKMENDSKDYEQKDQESYDVGSLENLDELLKIIFSSDDTSFIVEEQDQGHEANSSSSENSVSSDNDQNQLNEESNAKNLSFQYQINTNAVDLSNDSQEGSNVIQHIDRELHSTVIAENETQPVTTTESKIDMFDKNHNHSNIDGVLSNLFTSKSSTEEVSISTTDSGQDAVNKRIDLNLINNSSTAKNPNKDDSDVILDKEETNIKPPVSVKKDTVNSTKFAEALDNAKGVSKSTSNFKNKPQTRKEHPQYLITVNMNQADNTSETNSGFQLSQKSTSALKAATEAFNKAASSSPTILLSKKNETM